MKFFIFHYKKNEVLTDMYDLVPTNELAIESISCPLTPKSQSRISPLELTSILDGFTSREKRVMTEIYQMHLLYLVNSSVLRPFCNIKFSLVTVKHFTYTLTTFWNLIGLLLGYPTRFLVKILGKMFPNYCKYSTYLPVQSQQS